MNPDNSHDFDLRDPQDNARGFFHTVVKVDGKASAEAGREVHREVPYCQIMTPGSKDVYDQPVRESDKQRFPEAWAAYQNGRAESEQLQGTALESWPQMNPAMVADCKALNIRTVEDLANLNDIGLQKLGPRSREWQKKAQTWLKAADDGALVSKQQSTIDSLQDTIKELQEKIAALEEDKPKRGRPPKTEQAA